MSGAVRDLAAPLPRSPGRPPNVIRERAPVSVDVTADGPEACIVTVGSDSAAAVARYLSWWEVPFTVLDSDQLRAEVRLLAERYAQAAEA